MVSLRGIILVVGCLATRGSSKKVRDSGIFLKTIYKLRDTNSTHVVWWRQVVVYGAYTLYEYMQDMYSTYRVYIWYMLYIYQYCIYSVYRVYT